MLAEDFNDEEETPVRLTMGIHASRLAAARISVDAPQLTRAFIIPATVGPIRQPKEYEKTNKPNAWLWAPDAPNAAGLACLSSSAVVPRSARQGGWTQTKPKPARSKKSQAAESVENRERCRGEKIREWRVITRLTNEGEQTTQ